MRRRSAGQGLQQPPWLYPASMAFWRDENFAEQFLHVAKTGTLDGTFAKKCCRYPSSTAVRLRDSPPPCRQAAQARNPRSTASDANLTVQFLHV
jgi:hypothetical protein